MHTPTRWFQGARRALLGCGLMALAACQAPGPVGPDSPYYKVPVGSTLTLHQRLTIPAHTAGVYIQGGQVVEHKQLNPVNQYYVYCRLEVDDVQDTAQTVKPDEFTVHRVGSRREDVSRAYPMYASRGMGMGMDVGESGGGDEDAGPGMQNWSVDLYLHSPRQPQVRRLACQHWVYNYEAEYPTVDEIRKTLGKVMTLKLAK